MFAPNILFLNSLVLVMAFGSICHAESNNQMPVTSDPLYSQIQQLQSQVNQVNTRVAVLETYKGSNSRFTKALESGDNAKIRGRIVNHPHGR